MSKAIETGMSSRVTLGGRPLWRDEFLDARG
jgi:hypothetical protein